MSTTRCNRFNSSSRSRLSRRLSGFALCRYEPRRIYLTTARLEAQTSLETAAAALIGRFQTIQIINNGVTYESGYIENENIELKICFVAGTRILMADGTTKPIGQIHHGDLVLAVDHNDTEHDTPKQSKVTRFFDNDLKEVVKLTFDNQKTGKQITFTACETIQDPQNVYNFEVEEKHTHFGGVGNTNSTLVNNECSECKNNAYVAGNMFIFWKNFPSVSLCKTCGHAYIDPETFTRMYLNGNHFRYSKNWGVETNSHLNIYMGGCIGISKVSVNYDNSPFFTDGDKFYETYEEAATTYHSLREKTETALVAFSSIEPITATTSNRPLTKKNINYNHGTVYDYSALVEVNINGKKQSVWLHVTGSFNQGLLQ